MENLNINQMNARIAYASAARSYSSKMKTLSRYLPTATPAAFAPALQIPETFEAKGGKCSMTGIELCALILSLILVSLLVALICIMVYSRGRHDEERDLRLRASNRLKRYRFSMLPKETEPLGAVFDAFYDAGIQAGLHESGNYEDDSDSSYIPEGSDEGSCHEIRFDEEYDSQWEFEEEIHTESGDSETDSDEESHTEDNDSETDTDEQWKNLPSFEG